MENKSKTQKKKEAHDLQKLGERLLSLSSQQLIEMNLPKDILEAIKLAKRIKRHEALRRQMQYLGALMRKIDAEPIQKAVERIEMGDRRKALTFRKSEQMRDDLVNGDDDLITEIINQYPQVERQKLNQLVRQARKDKEKEPPSNSSRTLLRYLQEILSSS